MYRTQAALVEHADSLTLQALKRREQLEQKEDEPLPQPAPSLFSPTSSHLAHALHASSSVSTFDHLQSLFLLDDSHPCPCHWCLTSPHHRRARLRRQQRGWVSLIAPMVRYSHLPFRLLCRRFGADIAYTPMIIAAGFNRSQHARDADFQTNSSQRSAAHTTWTHSASRSTHLQLSPGVAARRVMAGVCVSGSAVDRAVRLRQPGGPAAGRLHRAPLRAGHRPQLRMVTHTHSLGPCSHTLSPHASPRSSPAPLCPPPTAPTCVVLSGGRCRPATVPR